MKIDGSIRIEGDGEVYPPSEDTYLLIESLEVRPGESVLEIGCGSGIVSIHCAKRGAAVTCGDVNPRAVALAARNAEANGASVRAVETDVFSNVEGSFDLIIFNLPYLPVEEEGLLARSWSGGADGAGPLPALLEGAPSRLRPGGRLAIVVSSLMDGGRLGSLLSGWDAKVLSEARFFFETVSVLELRPRTGSCRSPPTGARSPSSRLSSL
ncbi:MAG: methyltransferase [Candidatus Methanoplasma sp.]|nr:methyltransferase [Candidatus Methanoplasma sp.]